MRDRNWVTWGFLADGKKFGFYCEELEKSSEGITQVLSHSLDFTKFTWLLCRKWIER